MVPVIKGGVIEVSMQATEVSLYLVHLGKNMVRFLRGLEAINLGNISVNHNTLDLLGVREYRRIKKLMLNKCRSRRSGQ